MTKRRQNGHELPSQPLWYKDAVIYQVHVRSFLDSSGDGIGDFRGLAEKLDYVRDLGVTAIWVLPFYPSPLRDDGYDIADYTSVHPAYGTLADFSHFLREAHARGIRVITELVLNHTSDQHPWFQKARRSAPGTAARDFYVWSDDPGKYRDARIIFKDFETSNWSWDPVAGAHYWHRFYSHQPDLNFNSPQVRRAIMRVMDFWLDLGVDAFRLDAVPYLHEREGTTSENLPETHQELKSLRAHIDGRYRDRMLLAEANQWPEDAVAYFGEGDECHMAFHFPLMPRMFMALRMEDRYPIIDILEQTPAIPENCQWALFLRNHDELTLEMVTDEERDYMYRVYAKNPQARINLGIRRRLAPLLGNDRRRIELMNGLLMSLPGTPVIYYGDEIGMGDNIYLGDRNGVRTPMQWSADRNAGFSRANSQRLYLPVVIDPGFSYQTLNVEAQQENPHSLLWWTRRLISLRSRYQALSRGTLEFLYPANRKVLGFVRRYGDQLLLVVANLSRFVQYAELDLSHYEGMVPREVFGRARFPPITRNPYVLTVGPHSFYWFSLEKAPAEAYDVVVGVKTSAPPQLEVTGSWLALFEDPQRRRVEEFLATYLPTRRWFAGKSRPLKSVEITDVLPTSDADECGRILIARVEYTEGDPENYLVTVAFATGERAQNVLLNSASTVVARVKVDGREGVAYSGVSDRTFSLGLVELLARKRHLTGRSGSLVGVPAKYFRAVRGAIGDLSPRVLSAERSNTSLAYSDKLILKLFRRLDEGENPEVEIGRFLSEEAEFAHAPRLAGHLEFRPAQGEAMTLGVFLEFVPNEGDAWAFTLDNVGQYFERVIARGVSESPAPPLVQSLVELSSSAIPPLAQELLGLYLEASRLLGQRTAELHLALCSRPEDPRFTPEPFTLFHQRSLFQSFRNLTESVLDRLELELPSLPEQLQADARGILDLRQKIIDRFRFIVGRGISTLRIRNHGEYHLGQALWTGRDFVLIDFEGDTGRPITARRLKRSPLRDVAGMIRSFHYAVSHGVRTLIERGVARPEALPALATWGEYWYLWSASAFLRAYLRRAEGAGLLPQDRSDVEGLLGTYLLEKAVYELGYELENRPTWVGLPMQGISWLMSHQPGSPANSSSS